MSEMDPARPPLDYERRGRHAPHVEPDHAELLLKAAGVIAALLLPPAAVVVAGVYWWLDVYSQALDRQGRPLAVAPVFVFFTIVLFAVATVVHLLVRPRRSMAIVAIVAILVGLAALMEGICFARADPGKPANPPPARTQPTG
jgi:hypothetical protein